MKKVDCNDLGNSNALLDALSVKRLELVKDLKNLDTLTQELVSVKIRTYYQSYQQKEKETLV